MKEIKIFVSSTFKDMQIERDMLKTVVKPYLESRYKRAGISVELVDLRWGLQIEKESEAEKEILQTCMQEIHDCHPFFISFLGERYGWIPSDELRQKSCFALSNDDYSLLTRGSGMSVTEMEILYGAFGKDANLENCIFCFRSKDSYNGLNEKEKEEYYADADKVNQLKSAIKRKVCEFQQGTIIDYHIALSSASTEEIFSSLEPLCTQITKTLTEKIDKQLQNLQSEEVYTNKLVSDFITLHSVNSIQREEIEQQILDYVMWSEPGIIILSGESGYGKSYILSSIYKRLASQKEIIPIFYSTTFLAKRSSAADVLESWKEQWTRQTGEDLNFESEKNFEKKPVFFLDAAEYMEEDDYSYNLSFIPENVTVIISTRDKDLTRVNTRNRRHKTIYIPPFTKEEAKTLLLLLLHKSHFHISDTNLRLVLDKRTENINQYAYESPLWIYLVANTLINLDHSDFFATSTPSGRKITHDDYITSLINDLAVTPKDLFIYMVKKSHAYFGEENVSRFLACLCMSRYGLTMSDYERIYGNSQWNIRLFSNILHWFSSIVYDINSGEKTIFRHVIIEETLREMLRDKILEMRHKYVETTKAHLESNPKYLPEYLDQLIEIGNTSELIDYCSWQYEYDDIIKEAIISNLTRQDAKCENGMIPIWDRIGNSTTSFSPLERKVRELIDIEYHGDEFNLSEYYWLLCHIGWQLMNEGMFATALPLFYFLSERISPLCDEEEPEPYDRFEEYNPVTYHNMLGICYGNLSIICKELGRYNEALHFSTARFKAFLCMADWQDLGQRSRKASEAFYYFSQAEIHENWFGFKKDTINNYLKAIEIFESLDNGYLVIPHHVSYIIALRKMSSWYMKKRNADDALKLALKALEISESQIYICSESEHLQDYLVQFFVSSLHLWDILERLHIPTDNYEYIINNAWHKIQDIYPKRYSSSEFSYFYQSIKNIIDGHNTKQPETNAEMTEFDAKIAEAKDAEKQKRKQAAINLYIEAIQIAESLYESSPHIVIKEKIGEAYYRIGFLYQSKSDKEKYIPLSNENLLRAVEFGYTDAYYLLAANAAEMNDPVSEEEYLQKGSSANSLQCLIAYGLYLIGIENFNLGQQYLQEAIDRGSIEAKLWKAIFVFNGEGGYEKDIQDALDILASCKDENKIAAKIYAHARWCADEIKNWGIPYKLNSLGEYIS